MNRGLTTTATDMINGKIAAFRRKYCSIDVEPGSSQYRIRGSSLSASNNPLIVIDGLPIDNDGIKGVSNPLSTINPNDIATFTAIKRRIRHSDLWFACSNGVILITTKKGEKGSRPRVTYDGTFLSARRPNQSMIMGATNIVIS